MQHEGFGRLTILKALTTCVLHTLAGQPPACRACDPETSTHVAVCASPKWLHACSSLYSSPLAAYSRMRNTRFCTAQAQQIQLSRHAKVAAHATRGKHVSLHQADWWHRMQYVR